MPPSYLCSRAPFLRTNGEGAACITARTSHLSRRANVSIQAYRTTHTHTLSLSQSLSLSLTFSHTITLSPSRPLALSPSRPLSLICFFTC
jgi:hypothetical protein